MAENLKIVRTFWAAMQSNDFALAAELMTEDVRVYWPLSNELFIGREPFVRVNADYPAHGVWVFTIENIVADGAQVVTDVVVTDGVQTARAISFFKFDGQSISELVEYWPEPYAPPSWRRGLAQSID